MANALSGPITLHGLSRVGELNRVGLGKGFQDELPQAGFRASTGSGVTAVSNGESQRILRFLQVDDGCKVLEAYQVVFLAGQFFHHLGLFLSAHFRVAGGDGLKFV